MASTEVTDGNHLDAAEKDTTFGDIHKKASVDDREIVNDAEELQHPASDENRQTEETEQVVGSITNREEQERQSAEREPLEVQLLAVGSKEDEAEASSPEQPTDDSQHAKVKQEEEVDNEVKLTASEESREASKRFRKENVKLGKSDRNILKNPTDLYVLIQHKKWDDALKQVKKSPVEASEWTYRLDKNGNIMWRLLPLHASIILNAPEKLIKAILSAFPRGVQCQDDLGMLPIHLSFRAGIPPSIPSMLLHAYPQATEVRDFKGRRPLGLAQASSSPHRQAYLLLLKPKSTAFTQSDLAAVRSEVVAAVTEEKQAAFDKQIEAMKKAHQLEIERLEAQAAKMDELNRSLQQSLEARQVDSSVKVEKSKDIVEKETDLVKQDPDAVETGDSFATLAAVHTKLAQMEKAHKKEIANIVAEAESKEEQLERLVNEHFIALEKLKGKMGAMEDEHKHVVDRLIEEQKKKLKESQREYEGGNSKIIEELRAKISDMTEAHETEVNLIKHKFAEQIARLEATIAEDRELYQKKLKEVRESLDEKSEFGGASMCGDLEHVDSDNEDKKKSAAKIQDLETKLIQLQVSKIELEKELKMEMETLKERAESKVHKLQEALKELKDQATKQANAMAEEMQELQVQLNTLVNSKKESTQALSETLDLLETQEMHWSNENEELQKKIEQAEANLASKMELNAELRTLLEEKAREMETSKESSQEREKELLEAKEILEADIAEVLKSLEVEEAKTQLLQDEVHQLKAKAESMQTIIDTEKETCQIMAAQHEQEMAQLASKMKTIEVDLAAEKAQTGLLQVQISQLKDRELSMEHTLDAERQTNEILTTQLEETTKKLGTCSKEALDALKVELEAAKSKLTQKEEEEKETNERIEKMIEKEIDLNKNIESLIEKMMDAKKRSKEIETKMVRQLVTLQTEKNALQGTIMVLSRSLADQQDGLTLVGNESA